MAKDLITSRVVLRIYCFSLTNKVHDEKTTFDFYKKKVRLAGRTSKQTTKPDNP